MNVEESLKVYKQWQGQRNPRTTSVRQRWVAPSDWVASPLLAELLAARRATSFCKEHFPADVRLVFEGDAAAVMAFLDGVFMRFFRACCFLFTAVGPTRCGHIGSRSDAISETP
ncbi:hypothetical protein ACFX15_027721 [Malus domestica]